MTAEEFFDAGGLELLRERAKLLGRIEDELDAALDDSARAPLTHSWMLELDRSLALMSTGRHDSALAHLIIAFKLLLYWAVPDAMSATASFEQILTACPSLLNPAAGLLRAEAIVHGMARGEPAPLSEAVLLAEGLAATIRRLTLAFPRSEVLAAMKTLDPQ